MAMPVRPLMEEHKLIMRMVKIMGARLDDIKKSGEIDLSFIDTAVDFIRTFGWPMVALW